MSTLLFHKSLLLGLPCYQFFSIYCLITLHYLLPYIYIYIYIYTLSLSVKEILLFLSNQLLKTLSFSNVILCIIQRILKWRNQLFFVFFYFCSLERQYEDDPLVESFNVYMQIFLSQALEPGFLNAITANSGKLVW